MTEPIKVIHGTRTAEEAMKGNMRNKRLFVGSLPKDKSQKEVFQAMTTLTKGVVDVIMYASQQDRNRNRGYAFVEFDSHESAVAARGELQAKPPKLWGGSEIKVDWAEPENEVDDETMSKVKVLFVRNLSPITTEEKIRAIFADFGSIERVKKQGDYAFVHFNDRQEAERALHSRNNTNLDGSEIEVMWSKPVKNREQYRQRRGDRNPPAPVLPYNALQQIRLHQYLYGLPHRGLQSTMLPTSAAHENSLPLGIMNGYTYATPHQTPLAALGFASPLNAPAETGAQDPLTLQQQQQQQQQQQHQQQQHLLQDEASRSAQFIQPLGHAPGAVRTSISPHVHTRPYPLPNTSLHHLAQQTVQAPHSMQQGAVPPLPTLQHHPHYFPGFEFSNMSPAGYPPAFALYPTPYFTATHPGQEFFRTHYSEN